MKSIPSAVLKAEHVDAATTHEGSRRGADRSSPALSRVSRRALLGALALGSGAVRRGEASPPVGSGDPDPSALLGRLVNRVTFGLTEYELDLARSRGYQGYLEYHLAYESVPDFGMGSLLAHLTTINMSLAQLFGQAPTLVINELIEATLLRAWYSKRQLFERMVEFWTDHFNIDIHNGNCQWFKTVDDRDVIRANAMSTFPRLLAASAASPAMMFYLDNFTSVAASPNENYARELMELHTLGVDGGYSQRDVYEVARCFTGWGIHPIADGDPLSGAFEFNPANHDQGEKRVLGNVIPAGGGQQDALTVLNILSQHPSTAKFIATKLCKRFLGYSPSASLVSSVAGVYTSSGGDVRAMLRKVLAAENLADAPLKFKRPFHAYVSALRASGANMISTGAVRTQLSLSGHVPFNWGPPDGYPDSIEFWSGLVLPRWTYGALLANGNLSGVVVDPGTFFAGLTSADAMVAKIDRAFFGGEMNPGERERIRTYLLPDPPSLSRQKDALGLAIGSPGFQWY